MEGGGVAKWPSEGLEEIKRLKSEIEVAELAIAALVDVVREDGASWSTIGKALGVTTQSAHRRYADQSERGR